ncbi:uncharacterized protein LOC111602349 [Drosophila hydei]|uniref:Uncharacterized protein LOC111602349 n=1 Tax=Drosophila hydei TaxID=7224 RepID=A0A6J1MDQ9_DROHY|nr:uncharacterized protein LOC111602349 [Drosophila hydei]
MKKLLASFLIFICYGCLLLSQPGQALRIKRADSLANTTNNTESVLPVVAMALGTADLSDKQQVKNGSEANAAAAAAIADNDKDKELEQSNDLSAHLRRSKRRMSGLEESLMSKALHHGRRHNAAGTTVAAEAAAAAVPVVAPATAAAPAPAPYVYYNKLISPDGKQELKEFQLLSPNMVFESVQRDVNYGPAADVGGVLLLNADNTLSGHIRALAAKPSKHHHKHKSSLTLPPFLFLLQQMLQPSLNLELEPTQPLPQPRAHLEAPMYQFLDSAVDNALRNNHEVFEHLINEHDHANELSGKAKEKGKDKDKDKDTEKLKDAIDLLPMQKAAEKTKATIESGTNHKEDELLVSCPIHHEHHANINGDMIDDDVVLVKECHII